ncbi:MAG: hypothetical protein KJ771_04515, partial [Nanoarchaeota archaeon]|nr:hypothetical protein [Nanoarchaeota archaeon]
GGCHIYIRRILCDFKLNYSDFEFHIESLALRINKCNGLGTRKTISYNIATMRSLKRVASGMRQTTARAGKGKFKISLLLNLV